MSIGDVIFWYAVIFCVLLVPFIWLLLKRRADKSRTRETSSHRRDMAEELNCRIRRFVRRGNHRGLCLSARRRLGRGCGVRGGPDNRRSLVHTDGLADAASA